MTTKFTPGPWEMDELGNIRRIGEILPICSISLNANYESKDNAKLILAAPDLLEALQNALGVCQAYATQSITARQCSEMAEIAIAKALGEQQ